jgi:hypothetical protein
MEKNYNTLSEKYSHLFTKNELYPLPMFGFECGIGWYDLLDNLLNDINTYYHENYGTIPEEFHVDQIKEKFGGLRFYVSGSDKYVDDLISKAEDLSYQTCEFCGSNDDIMHSSGWIVTACKKCIESNDRLKGRSWKPHQ